jgi:hypothetical protein
MNKIQYRSGYKYQLAADYDGVSAILGFDGHVPWVDWRKDGTYTVRVGYCWDGPSGPTIDDKTNMRGSLGHDVKYQLMRLGILPQLVRETADRELQRECIEDGMWKWRAWYYFEGVDHFAAYAARYGTEQKIKEAP